MLSHLKNTQVTSSLLVPGIAPPSGLIGTHDGSFHCDEALAIGMLKLLPQYIDAVVLRTRKPELLSQCNIVVDVGATYEPALHRYDHHQREFAGTLEGYGTKLSSAGLVYKHFGKDIIREILKNKDGEERETNEEFVDICFHSLYKNFIEHIDAIDNGISVSDAPPRYHVSTTLSSRVGALNPSWNEPQTPEIFNERFLNAVALACSEFLSHAHQLANVWWPARSIVQKALTLRFETHPSGKIIIFDQACPWKEHLFDIEKEQGIEPVVYALYADTGGSWRIQAVPQDPQSFLSRKKVRETISSIC